jgi:hypothetical protein
MACPLSGNDPGVSETCQLRASRFGVDLPRLALECAGGQVVSRRSLQRSAREPTLSKERGAPARAPDRDVEADVDPMRSSKWVQCLSALGVLAALLAGCGGDDDDEGKNDDEPVTIPLGHLPCGASSCAPYTELPGLSACCKDAFVGTCGVTTKSFDDCREPPELDDRCEVPDVIASGLLAGREAAYGCCLPSNECGLAVLMEFDFTNPIFSALTGEQGFPTDECFSIRDICSDTPTEMLGFQPQTCDGEPLEFNKIDCWNPKPRPEEPPPDEPAP